MNKRICVVTPEYPSENRPYIFTFVDQLVCTMADMDVDICVITPHDLFKYWPNKEHDRIRCSPGGKEIKVFSPGVFTLTTRKLGPFNLSLLTEKLFIWSVKKTIKKNRLKPDILYAHFLFPAGTCVATLGKKLGIPSVCAFGESSLWSIREIGLDRAKKKLIELSGVIAVSTNNKNVLIDNQLVAEGKIKVIPNAVNKSVFCPGDKTEVRKKLKLPLDTVIGLYNGSFSRAKGSLRVDAAAKEIPNLKMVYLGGGKDEPKGNNVLFKGRVAHEDVSTWLQAADFFVLPTLEEGCCNAIIEAMSTGLPIITSDKPFNYDILDYESAMLVDPMNIDELHNAIENMAQSSEIREKYGNAALKKSAGLDINTRAKRILDYLNNM